MKKALCSILALAAVAAIALLVLRKERPGPASPGHVPDTRSTVTELAEATPEESASAPSVEEAAAPAVREKPPAPSEEVLATRRMYQAHASLRSPEVDDPDSATNQEVKRQLIAKALERAAKAAE